MGNRVGRILLSMVLLASVLAMTAIAITADAGQRDIVGDWVVTGGVTSVEGDTIDVTGNVTVTDGGVLEIRNCTLSIDGPYDGAYGLNVTSRGKLQAWDCVITGGDGRITMQLRGDTTIGWSSISHVWGQDWNAHAIDVLGGDVSISNSTISDGSIYGIVVCSDLALDNVTISGVPTAVFVINRNVAEPFAVTMVRCHLISYASGIGVGVSMSSTQYAVKIKLDVQRSTIEGYDQGMYLNTAGPAEVRVTDCEILGNTQGALLGAWVGSISMSGNRIGHCPRAGSAGLNISEIGAGSLTLGPNTIENVANGIVVEAWSAGNAKGTYGHQTIANCTVGVSAYATYDSGLGVTIGNSTLANCTTCFLADSTWSTYPATISIFDTIHVVGSGKVLGARAEITSYATIDIGTVTWRGDGRILHGWLLMENETGAEVARFDLYSLEPQSVIGWRLNRTVFVKHYYLWPATYSSSHRFTGPEMDIWAHGRVDIELIDDVPPAVGIDQLPLAFINVTTLAVTGNYSDLGSGVSSLRFSLDGAGFSEITSYHDGSWTRPVIGLADGQHSFLVEVADAAGNEGAAVTWTFVVDTVRPFIDVAPPPALVNTTEVTVIGRVEPGSTLTIAGGQFDVAPDGAVSAVVPLVEGENVLDVAVVDLAGNRNSTRFVVVSDTIPPALDVEDPPAWSWTKARQVTVDGTVEPGAVVRVNGMEVVEASGWYSRTLTLAEGTLMIVVTAADEAGNTARVEVVLIVDWTTPSLTIDQPAGGSQVTHETEVYIEGSVDDPTIDHAAVNGEPVALISGRFVFLCELAEGENVYNVSVVDAAGNSNSTVVTITSDTIRPTYVVELTVSQGSLVTIGGQVFTNASVVTVHLVADEPVTLTIAAEAARPSGRDIRYARNLTEGMNIIGITPVDMAGNEGDLYTARITRDTTPPELVIIDPAPGFRTAGKEVELHGRTEVGSSVTVLGKPVGLDANGAFRVLVLLEQGPNDIRVESVDPMGNANSTVVSVERTGGETAGGGSYLWLLLALVIVVVALVAIYAVKGRRA